MNAGGGGRIVAPAYGTVRRAVEFGLFYYVVDGCTETLVALLSETPWADAVPRVTTGAAVALWMMLLPVLAVEARRQYRANPVGPDGLEAVRPTGRTLAVAGVATAAGGAAAAAGWAQFARVLAEPAEAALVLADLGGAGGAGAALWRAAATPTLVGTVAAVGGTVVFAYGLDRLVVGLVREGQYRRLSRGATASAGD